MFIAKVVLSLHTSTFCLHERWIASVANTLCMEMWPAGQCRNTRHTFAKHYTKMCGQITKFNFIPTVVISWTVKIPRNFSGRVYRRNMARGRGGKLRRIFVFPLLTFPHWLYKSES